MQGTFLFLGTGASTGVPVVTCRCAVCLSKNPHNYRLRPAGFMRVGKKQILFDAGPDLRLQALKHGIEDLDAVVLTHTHFDHIAGLDDLRVFYCVHNKKLPCLLSDASYAEIKERYHYFFHTPQEGRFDFHILQKDKGIASFAGLEFTFMSYWQQGMKVLGYRVGNFAYVLDIKEYDEAIFQQLQGTEVLVVSALRDGPSPAHLSLEEAVLFARKVGAKETWISHISHRLDHEATNQTLPADVQLAYDGLEIFFNAS